jgi:hypothetical protein
MNAKRWKPAKSTFSLTFWAVINQSMNAFCLHCLSCSELFWLIKCLFDPESRDNLMSFLGDPNFNVNIKDSQGTPPLILAAKIGTHKQANISHPSQC